MSEECIVDVPNWVVAAVHRKYGYDDGEAWFAGDFAPAYDWASDAIEFHMELGKSSRDLFLLGTMHRWPEGVEHPPLSGEMYVVVRFSPDKETFNKAMHTMLAWGTHSKHLLPVLIYQQEYGIGIMETLHPALPLDDKHKGFAIDDTASYAVASTIFKAIYEGRHSIKKDAHSTTDDLLNAFLASDIKSFLPKRHLDDSTKRARSLLHPQEMILLHGDLHHGNILYTDFLRLKDTWVALDPKGVIGERAYEIAAFVRNPIDKIVTYKNIKKLLRERIIYFADEFNLLRSHVLDWCYVGAILAIYWAHQDKEPYIKWLYIADVLQKLKVPEKE